MGGMVLETNIGMISLFKKIQFYLILIFLFKSIKV